MINLNFSHSNIKFPFKVIVYVYKYSVYLSISSLHHISSAILSSTSTCVRYILVKRKPKFNEVNVH